MEDEELIFKRFPEEKQEQVRGLVQYATLMGLSGKDLVSIGGKLDRLRGQQERKRNMDIINSFKCLLIGEDRKAPKSYQDGRLDIRFKLETANGVYRFDRSWGDEWTVTSYQTKYQRSHNVAVYDYDIPTKKSWETRIRYALLLDIDCGRLQLNF